jgi:hypothetical protein
MCVVTSVPPLCWYLLTRAHTVHGNIYVINAENTMDVPHEDRYGREISAGLESVRE